MERRFRQRVRKSATGPSLTRQHADSSGCLFYTSMAWVQRHPAHWHRPNNRNIREVASTPGGRVPRRNHFVSLSLQARQARADPGSILVVRDSAPSMNGKRDMNDSTQLSIWYDTTPSLELMSMSVLRRS
jgi:hypothetical protein